MGKGKKPYSLYYMQVEYKERLLFGISGNLIRNSENFMTKKMPKNHFISTQYDIILLSKKNVSPKKLSLICFI